MTGRRIRGLICALLACVLVWTGLMPTTALAAGETLQIKGISVRRLAEGALGVSLSAKTARGTSMKADPASLVVQVNGQTVEPRKDNDTTTGYIFVVDFSKQASRQGGERLNNSTKAWKSLLSGLMNYVDPGDGVAVVWVSDVVEVEGFGATNIVSTFEEKREKVKDDSAKIYDGVLQAVKMAEADNGGYDYYTVYILTDGMSSKSTIRLDESAQIIQEGRPISVFAFCMYQGNKAYTSTAQAGTDRANLSNFVSSVGGVYEEIDIRNDKDIDGLIMSLTSRVSEEVDGILNLRLPLTGVAMDLTEGKTEISVNFADGSTRAQSRTVYINTSVLPTPTPTPEPNATPTPAPTPVARWGDTNNETVKRLQAALNGYRFLDQSPTGNFDNATKDAILAYMDLRGMIAKEQDGILYLMAEDAQEILDNTLTPTPAPTVAPFIDETTDVNPANVMLLQDLLRSTGWYDGESTGRIDSATRKAYSNLYSEMGYRVTGNGEIIITQDFWNRFLKDGDVPTPTPVPATDTPEPTPEIVIQKGGDPETIKELQKLLTDNHYYYGVIDGDFGYETQQAYNALRAALGWGNKNRVDGYSGTVIDREEWNELLTYKDLPTAAPTASPEPTAEPMAVDPYIPLKLGDVDGEGESYISAMQNRLRELGYYEYIQKEYTNGEYGESTKEALAEFYKQVGTTGDGSDISVSLLRDYLFADSAPHAPEYNPSPVDQLREFLMTPRTIANFTFPTWVLVAVAAALLMAIIIVLVLILSRKKKKNDTEGSADFYSGPMDTASHTTYTPPVTPSQPSTSAYNPGVHASDSTVGSYDREKTLDAFSSGLSFGGGDSEKTQDVGYGRSVSLELNFNGQKTTKYAQIMNKLVIGRHKEGVEIDIETDPADRAVSRPHCELVLQNDQLYVRNLSNSSQGTLLNGRKVMGAQTQSQDTGADVETISLDALPMMMNTSGMEQVMSGDELTVGQHRIKVTYQWG